ncbi:MAG: cupin domain-containing protein [Candidatus Rokubacteria bacterium]|nr:cupin domain-containing protein [Candidatus Rokubacteria bacterium]
MRIVVRRGEGEVLLLGGTRPIEILIEPGTTGTRAFTMGTQTLPPGGEVPLHKHPEEEILFVYEGSGRVNGGRRRARGGAGDGRVPPGRHLPPDREHRGRRAALHLHALAPRLRGVLPDARPDAHRPRPGARLTSAPSPSRGSEGWGEGGADGCPPYRQALCRGRARGDRCLRITPARARRAAFTSAAFGKTAATSGSSTTTLLPSA